MGCSASNTAKDPTPQKQKSLAAEPSQTKLNDLEQVVKKNLEVAVIRGVDLNLKHDPSTPNTMNCVRLRSWSLSNLHRVHQPSPQRSTYLDQNNNATDNLRVSPDSTLYDRAGSQGVSRDKQLDRATKTSAQPSLAFESYKRAETAGNDVPKNSLQRKVIKQLTEKDARPGKASMHTPSYDQFAPGLHICKLTKSKSKRLPSIEKIDLNFKPFGPESEPQSPSVSIMKMRSGSQKQGISRGFSGHQQELLSRLPSAQSSSKRIGSFSNTVKFRNKDALDHPQNEQDMSICPRIKVQKKSQTLKDIGLVDINSACSQRLEIPLRYKGSFNPSENGTRSGLLNTDQFRSTLNNLDPGAEEFERAASMVNVKSAEKSSIKTKQPGITIQITPVEPQKNRTMADSKVVKGFDFSDVLNWSDVDEPEIPFLGGGRDMHPALEPPEFSTGDKHKKPCKSKLDGLQGLLELLDNNQEISVVHVPPVFKDAKSSTGHNQGFEIKDRFFKEIPAERPKFGQQEGAMKLNPSLVFKRPANNRIGAVKVVPSHQALLPSPQIIGGCIQSQQQAEAHESPVLQTDHPIYREAPLSAMRKKPQRQRSEKPGLLRRFTCPEQ